MLDSLSDFVEIVKCLEDMVLSTNMKIQYGDILSSVVNLKLIHILLPVVLRQPYKPSRQTLNQYPINIRLKVLNILSTPFIHNFELLNRLL